MSTQCVCTSNACHTYPAGVRPEMRLESAICAMIPTDHEAITEVGMVGKIQYSQYPGLWIKIISTRVATNSKVVATASVEHTNAR